MGLLINFNTKIKIDIKNSMNMEPVKRAVNSLKRDMGKVFLPTEKAGARICLIESNQEMECFQLVSRQGRLEIQAGDELGFVYGIYEVSRSFLGIMDLWFWNDQKINKRWEIQVEDQYKYQSEPFCVKLRGWFVNDEVLIHTWSVNRQKDTPWEMVFEALLRCGGNMVIPGTDRNASYYRKMASDMGLFITHHHAEPLGAEMFARAYPNLNPSYEEHPEKFRLLWREGIQNQKNHKIVWNLGFRGQGDCPFWVNDPRYQTNASRGELMSRLIKMQYDMVKEALPQAICCTNLYGETMELYQEGHLKLPEDVIKIWADNGFGKMVTRRQENHNPRIPALPNENDSGRHGIYYHVSFYDLQAANHITMLPNSPEFVKHELEEVLHLGVKDYWIINCSNVKPHVFYLDFLANFWRRGTVDVKTHREKYIDSYYGQENRKEVGGCLKAYFQYALAFGEQEDEHAGEQFANYVTRILISQFMKDKEQRAEELLWATEGKSLKEQIQWYQRLCRQGRRQYQEYLVQCEKMALCISDSAKKLFEDSFLLQAKIYARCYQGAFFLCESLLKAMEGEYQKAFYFAGRAKKEYTNANHAMRSCEHGKWHGFYENECLTDVKQTAWVLRGLMAYLRNLGDGPFFYGWQRELLYAEEDRRVLLILNMENHLEDEEIFKLMDEKWGE